MHYFNSMTCILIFKVLHKLCYLGIYIQSYCSIGQNVPGDDILYLLLMSIIMKHSVYNTLYKIVYICKVWNLHNVTSILFLDVNFILHKCCFVIVYN